MFAVAFVLKAQDNQFLAECTLLWGFDGGTAATIPTQFAAYIEVYAQ